MADSVWNSVNTIVLTGTVEDLRTAVLPAAAGAIVVDTADPFAALLVLLPRTAIPLIVIADVDAAGAAALVSAGADDVLSRAASFADVARAARHASARRARRTGAAAPAPAATTPDTLRAPDVSEVPAPPVSAPPSASQTPSSAPARIQAPPVVKEAAAPTPSPHPRDAGPSDMPPQLQAVGRLAGGVAHDFNNLLQVIGGSAEGLVHELEPGDSRREAAQAIVDAARRAATLTHQLLAFGRRQTLIATPLDLSTLITEALTHLRSRAGQRIRIVTKLAPSLPAVHADRSQILEVLSNLADNAFEAMPDGGTLAISTADVEVDDGMRVGRPWLRPGRYVQIQMSDTGVGIDADILPHLFEPFFSTKSQWGGTGLGLSSVYGIVKQSNGFIWVESTAGEGTRITILLPPAAAPALQAPLPSELRGRLVLVEDDEGVRELLVGVLTHYGYTVDAYKTAEEALAHDGAFDLLLSDVLLPGMNGPDLARAMKKARPGVPVLLMSGDTGHVVDPKELDVRGFLQKPFSARTLVSRVEELIASARGRKKRPVSDR